MHYVQSAKNMPGMTIIIYVFLMIFGDLTFNFWIAIKLFWISMGALAIYGVYKIIKMYANPVIASIICLLFCQILQKSIFLYLNSQMLRKCHICFTGVVR